MNIKLARIIFILVVIGIAYIIYSSCIFLPERVATNFGKDGKIVSLNSRETYRTLMTFLALLLPITIYIAMKWLPRWINPRFVCPSNHKYWFSPERSSLTLIWMEKFGIAIGILVSIFWFALHLINIRANRIVPSHYELWLRLSLLIGWLVSILWSVIIYRRHFRRAP